MQSGTEAAALEALSDLVSTAQGQRDELVRRRLPGSAQTFDHLAVQLDLVRAKLTAEHELYLPEAWAFVDAARLTIARHLVNLDRRAIPTWTR
jgi:hypothetical protein